MDKQIGGIGIADILIIGAEILHDFADQGLEATAQSITTLKSTGKKYRSKIIVELVEDNEEL